MNKINKKIAFIGVGNMAGAIIRGITGSDKLGYPYSCLRLYNRHPEKCSVYKDSGAVVSPDIQDAVSNSDIIFLSVKPQNFPEILPEIVKSPGYSQKLYVTIAAGITVDSVSEKLGGAMVIRALPNTPMLIGQGVTAICTARAVPEDLFSYVCSLFEASGRIIIIEEEEMNRIISVTSSAPAYVFLLINAIYKGALAQGLSSENILGTICDMVAGSANLLKSGSDTPDAQIKRVASPGGTTERALNYFNENDFTGIVIEAMRKCTERANELGSRK